MAHRVSDRVRLDVLLCSRGLAASRSKAQELVRSGRVRVAGAVVDKVGLQVDPDAEIAVTPGLEFVSRGGAKLEGALAAFSVPVAGAVAADLGASTGGFTDCLLRRGARKVYAVDVGRDQLAVALRGDPRVVVRDGTNARDLDAPDFDEPLDLVVVDASFIALAKLVGAIRRILPPGKDLVALVKPQFEAGREVARRARGVIRDPEDRERAIDAARQALTAAGFEILEECDSPLPGPDGNLERFVRARR